MHLNNQKIQQGKLNQKKGRLRNEKYHIVYYCNHLAGYIFHA
jgi:hypothetical protein